MFPYIGGKKQHSKWIDPFYPDNFETYVEPFGGAFWMYWQSKHTPVQTNVYNDFNRHLVNVFACASTDPAQYHQELLNLYPFVGNPDKFIEFRDEIHRVFDTHFSIPDYQLAAKYMFCQTQIFTGNRGLTSTVKMYVDPEKKNKFYTYAEKFQQSKFLRKLNVLKTENMDCRDLIKKYDSPTTFFYIDPPYFNLEDYYTKNSFGREDHIELLTLLTNIQGKFALSYYYFSELEDIMPRDKFYWHEQETYSNNGLTVVENAFTKDGRRAKGVRTKRTEVLIMNYTPPQNTFDKLFSE